MDIGMFLGELGKEGVYTKIKRFLPMISAYMETAPIDKKNGEVKASVHLEFTKEDLIANVYIIGKALDKDGKQLFGKEAKPIVAIIRRIGSYKLSDYAGKDRLSANQAEHLPENKPQQKLND